MKTTRVQIIILGLLFFPVVRVFAQNSPSADNIVSTGKISDERRANTDGARALTLAEAIELALKQASNFRGAQIGERIAAEDVRQARVSFYPKIDAKPNYIYTSPSLGSMRPRPPSFLGANAINEIQGLITASGEIDISGKLNATLRRNRSLLAAAQADRKSVV